MISIIVSDNRTLVNFCSVRYGTPFRCDGQYYLMVDAPRAAAKLSTGHLVEFASGDKVEVAQTAELTLTF